MVIGHWNLLFCGHSTNHCIVLYAQTPNAKLPMTNCQSNLDWIRYNSLSSHQTCPQSSLTISLQRRAGCDGKEESEGETLPPFSLPITPRSRHARYPKTTGNESASLMVINMRGVEVAPKLRKVKTAASMLQSSWKGSRSRKLARASSPFCLPLFSAVFPIYEPAKAYVDCKIPGEKDKRLTNDWNVYRCHCDTVHIFESTSTVLKRTLLFSIIYLSPWFSLFGNSFSSWPQLAGHRSVSLNSYFIIFLVWR